MRLRDELLARLRDWQAAGVWRRLHQMLLERLHAAGEIDWSRRASTARACRPKKGVCHGPNPTDRGKAGTKRHLSPTRVARRSASFLTGANCHDSPLMAPTLDGIPPLRIGRRGLRADDAPTSCTLTRPTMRERDAESAGRAGSRRGLHDAASREMTGLDGIAGWSSAATPGSTVPAACPSATSAAPTSTNPSRSSKPASSPSIRSIGSVRCSKSATDTDARPHDTVPVVGPGVSQQPRPRGRAPRGDLSGCGRMSCAGSADAAAARAGRYGARERTTPARLEAMQIATCLRPHRLLLPRTKRDRRNQSISL